MTFSRYVAAMALFTSIGLSAQDRQVPKPEDLDPSDGVAVIPDRATFAKLSYKGSMRMDAYLSGVEFVKFILTSAATDKQLLYWMNTRNSQAHPMFMRKIGLNFGRGRGRGGFGRRGPGGDRGRGTGQGRGGDQRGAGQGRGGDQRRGAGQGRGGDQRRGADQGRGAGRGPDRGRGRGGPGGGRGGSSAPGTTMRGAVSFWPRVAAPDGSVGIYVYDFQPSNDYSPELLKACQDALIAKAPFLRGKLAYHPLRGALARVQREKADFIKAGIPLCFDEDLDSNIVYLPMNVGVSYGRLRRMNLEQIPGPRDIVFYETLPNELPRVAGMITGERQTPLSHVNLRAIQDKVPNAYVKGASDKQAILDLLGKNVRYEVKIDGWTLREATSDEVEKHFANLRPKTPQTPPLNLEVRDIRGLDEIMFGEASAWGVKATNLAAMRFFPLPEGVIPDGYAVPFSFYFDFMKHNGIDKLVTRLVESEELRRDASKRKAALKQLRKAIRSGVMPEAQRTALGELQAKFKGAPIRCRSSTNNEDLPGFSGAGLYSSYTHNKDEGHLAKTIQQVYASLWSDRAFEERDFYRVDQSKTAMGVLVVNAHKGELANGVAVTLDVLYDRFGHNYVNAQVGEDMVTNPDSRSIPEEVLLPFRRGTPRVMQKSNRVADGKRVLSQAQLDQLQDALQQIHNEFALLYKKRASDPKFAIEIEFKITKDGKLLIKQARPWVFAKS